MRHDPRKSIRLAHESYAADGSVWLVSIATWNRKPLFTETGFADVAQEELRRQHGRRGTRLLVYCVMPNHVHAVFQIGEIDLFQIIGAYKAYVSRRLRAIGHEGEVWQQRFHDRGIRQSVNMDDVVKYVVSNPVDKGLVSEWQEWKWTGGELIESEPPK